MRVLVVEDDVTMAETIRDGLALQCFTVDLRHDGAAGLSAASGDAYDVIVLDIMLPRIDGREVCRQLRERNVRTPILMLSATSPEDVTGDMLALGADDFLGKPFSFPVLVARLRALSQE